MCVTVFCLGQVSLVYISNSKIRNSALRVVQDVTSVCQLTGSQQRVYIDPAIQSHATFLQLRVQAEL